MQGPPLHSHLPEIHEMFLPLFTQGLGCQGWFLAALLSWRCHLDPQLTNGKRKAQNVQATSPRSQTWAIGGRG